MSERKFPPQSQAKQPGEENEMAPEPEYIRADYRGTGKLEGKTALPHMGDGDKIIATSSVNAIKGNDTLIDYSATKGARAIKPAAATMPLGRAESRRVPR